MGRFDQAFALIKENYQISNVKNSPGMSISVSFQKSIEHFHFGAACLESKALINPSTKFHAASLAKQFTGAAICLLEREGKLKLTDTVATYLKFIPQVATKITILQLLDHTSGLRDQWVLKFLAGWRDHDLFTMDDAIRLTSRQKELNFSPAREHSYCNTGYTLLALIVENISGVPFELFIESRLFTPAKMANSLMRREHNRVLDNEALAYRFDEENRNHYRSLPPFNIIGATSLVTTSEDLVKWAAFIQKNGLINCYKKGKLSDKQEINYSRGLIKSKFGEEHVLYHSGWDYGYSSLIMIFPKQELSIAILANCYSPSLDVLGILLANKVMDLGEQYQAIAEASLSDELHCPKTTYNSELFTGVYSNSNTGELLSFKKSDSGPILDIAQGYPLIKLNDDEFLIQGTISKIKFDGHDKLYRSVAGSWNEYSRCVVTQPSIRNERTVGFYYSEELNSVLEISCEEKNLQLSFPRGEKYKLRHLSGDKYVFNGMTVLFKIGMNDEIIINISHPRATNIKFIKGHNSE
ncbi:beta-lactamase family protein [Alteromonas mediterranea]|uniref:serine hydrolase domain-containing protein n=1 Tax=Alteromonas mediterranea TaxID=314275 RepID=UPI000C8DE55E|nr:serine hydrolase domain-containing protein [Alteromonas mediterranea]MAG66160.1 hypothetical protein [Pseudomonadales bacterium]QDG35961.1 beta-lactamase family protein [Alteromonas mediterranea]|tara:strand:+ start:11044 stop:12618 length:1575 start_codon:yes stop_codon:yes gene_type:complete